MDPGVLSMKYGFHEWLLVERPNSSIREWRWTFELPQASLGGSKFIRALVFKIIFKCGKSILKKEDTIANVPEELLIFTTERQAQT